MTHSNAAFDSLIRVSESHTHTHTHTHTRIHTHTLCVLDRQEFNKKVMNGLNVSEREMMQMFMYVYSCMIFTYGTQESSIGRNSKRSWTASI